MSDTAKTASCKVMAAFPPPTVLPQPRDERQSVMNNISNRRNNGALGFRVDSVRYNLATGILGKKDSSSLYRGIFYLPMLV